MRDFIRGRCTVGTHGLWVLICSAILLDKVGNCFEGLHCDMRVPECIYLYSTDFVLHLLRQLQHSHLLDRVFVHAAGDLWVSVFGSHLPVKKREGCLLEFKFAYPGHDSPHPVRFQCYSEPAAELGKVRVGKR